MKKMDDATLINQIELLESESVTGDEVAHEQAQAMDYYLRKPFGTEEEGRSQVVSSDVWDVVEGLTPLVLKPFVSSDDVVRFNPEGPEDEEAAEQESDYINYVVTQKNDVFSTLVTWVKTGLLQKNGIVKYWWEKTRRTTIERYEGLDDDLYALLIEDENITVVEHSEKPGDSMQDPQTGAMVQGSVLHDVVIRVSKEHGEAKYRVIPPEEFLISRDATTPNPKDARFVEHRTHKTISDLRAMGYDVADDISDTSTNDPRTTDQYQARQAGNQMWANSESRDPASREVLYREIFMLVDYDGDGIAELRKICMVGKTVLANEETEEIPFCAWTPYQQLFQFNGRCPADETIEIQLTKSTLWRQNLDNIYTINNNRVFASDKVNLDDLLDNQIAGVVRVRGDVVGNHVMTAPIQPIGAIIQPMMEYLDGAKENRTGFSRYNQGSADLGNQKTLGEIQIVSEQSNERTNLVSRSFAELGLKPLMLGIHGLCRRHATKAETIKLRGKWVTVNPRNWATRFDMTVSVGLGNSDMRMKMQGAQMVLEKQMMLAPTGIVSPDNFYQAARKLAEAVGEKNPDKYFTSPKDKAEQEQGPDPQSQEQIKQLGAALEAAAGEVDKLELAAKDKQGELSIKQFDAETKRLALDKNQPLPESPDKSALIAQQTAIEVARINAESHERIELMKLRAPQEAQQAEAQAVQQQEDAVAAQNDAVAQAIAMLAEAMSRPKQIMRDASGRVTGVQ